MAIKGSKYARKHAIEKDQKDDVLEIALDDDVPTALARILKNEEFVESFHNLDYDEAVDIYQTLASRATPEDPDSEYKLRRINEDLGFKIVERQGVALSKDERRLIRMDFYGTVDRISEAESLRKLSKYYRYFMSHPLKRRPSSSAYDFSSAPCWSLFTTFQSFRGIENKLKNYLVAHKIDPKILKVMDVRDFSDLIVQTFQKDKNEHKIKFQKISIRNEFVRELTRLKGDDIAQILLKQGHDYRYVHAMINAMKKYGMTTAEKLTITEVYFTGKALADLKRAKINCKGFKVGDKIPQSLIDNLLDNNQARLIVARDKKGRPLEGKDFPSFEVHHIHAVGEGGDLPNVAYVNYKNNFCLVARKVHQRVLHAFDLIDENNVRDAYSRRTEFVDPYIVFVAGLKKKDQFSYDFHHGKDYTKRMKKDDQHIACYKDCMKKLQENRQSFDNKILELAISEQLKKGKKRSKIDLKMRELGR